MIKSDSLIKLDSSEINPFILDEETRYMLNKSHYVLGESNYRKLQESHHQRTERRKELAIRLGVDYIEPELTPKDEIIKSVNAKLKYLENKEVYDKITDPVLQYYTQEEIIQFLQQNMKP